MFKVSAEMQQKIRQHTWKWILGTVAFLLADLFTYLRFGLLPAFTLLLALLSAILLALAWLGWSTAKLYQAQAQASDRQARVQSELAGESLAAAQERLRIAEQQRGEEKRRLATLIQLNRVLAESTDEHALMNSALAVLNDLVGGLGCSFVPVDEWDQPLPAFTHGQLPEPVLRAWAAHLTGSMLRERCARCKLLVGPIGECPLHPGDLGDSMRVFCLPVSRASVTTAMVDLPVDFKLPVNNQGGQPARRKLGILHLYLPAGRVIDPDMRAFLDGILQEIVLAYENIHLRRQEVTTLRQLQMLRAPENDFMTSLRAMLDGLQQALETDSVLIRLRPSTDERLANLNLLSGRECPMEDEQVEAIFTRVVASAVANSAAAVRAAIQSETGSLPVWVALPLILPDGRAQASTMPAGHVLGMLMVVANRPFEFHPRQMAILHTVAAQAALLIENERLIRSLEYKVVIQERARLAREIHDGLAQTLAYLKMQSAQMQTYLAQGDTTRLSQVLKDNYTALAEAYLDTRQAIDNLRLTPREGLHAWLERILREFENSANLRVERRIQQFNRPITPEVQAQLIRILQETLSNVRKHSRARSVRLDLREWKGDLILEVTDDGLGFDADDIPEISRHGLRGMRERAEMIGADFQIISQARQGTTIRLVLPASLEEGSLQ